MGILSRAPRQLRPAWRWRRAGRSVCCSTGCQSAVGSAPSGPDPVQAHKEKLFQWFRHLPAEELQFGGAFNPETMHVEPLILERRPEERAGPAHDPARPRLPLTAEQLFRPANAWSDTLGLNVLLYGAVGTGKSTVFRKLVLDWCSGVSLTQFRLLLPFSCEDLGQLSRASSLRDLVSRKYLHLRNHPLLSGEGDQAKEVLFLFNGVEKMQLDFRIGCTELCSDPGAALPPDAVVVNLLRKYLLPEASVLVTTRLSAVERVPHKYVARYAQLCGFNDPDHHRAYFSGRLLRPGDAGPEARALLELLFLNLQRESQLAAACFLPSYCWLTCATLHFLHFTSDRAPIRTLTAIYTSFLRLNFGGEVVGRAPGAGPEPPGSLMLYVVRTVGRLAFDGVRHKRTSFSEKEVQQRVGGGAETDEELHLMAVFQTDVLDFFLAPCADSRKFPPREPGGLGAGGLGAGERRYVFAVPAMQEYLAALYVVLGENKSALEKLGGHLSEAIGQAGEDVGAVFNVLAKLIPLRVFAVFNLLKLLPRFYEKVSRHNKGRIARAMAAAMFSADDADNEDVLDQLEQSLLGVHGPAPRQQSEARPFELYPIFMGGLLHYGNRALLQQLGCSIHSSTVAQITRALRSHLVREIHKPLPPEELMDVLVLLYEFQNPRLTAEVLTAIRSVRLANIRMTPVKCFILSSVLSCMSPSDHLEELDLSSCMLSQHLLQRLAPAFRHAHKLNLQFNSLGPESCVLLRDLLLDSKVPLTSLQLCDNPLLDSGCSTLLEALTQNQTLTHLSLMHTGLGDPAALQLVHRLQGDTRLQELNVAYNGIGDAAALALVDACREHPSMHTVHLYLNALTDVGKQSLHVRGGARQGSRRVRVLASVTEGADISEDWHPILSVIRENSSSWDRQHLKEQLEVFLRDLEWGRQQQQSFWKRLHFRRVENGVRQTLKMLESDSGPAAK